MTPMERIEGELSDAQKRIAELERRNVGLANESCAQQEQITELKNALARQAKAAISGMDAAKAAASSNLEHAKRLHAESSPEALESERAANAVLTELVAKLEHERDAYRTAEEHQIARRQKIEQERDALAAHVERLRERLAMCRHYACYSIGDSTPLAMQLASIREVASEALREEPKGSLARHDLIKQAEELESTALHLESIDGCGIELGLNCAANELNHRAAELRRQAEAQQ